MATRSTGSRRAAALLLAVIVAGAGTFIVFQSVNGIEAQALEGAELVEVFVADGVIEEGTAAADAIGAGLVRRDQVLRRSAPAGAVGSLDDLDGTVVLSSVLPGEVLLLARFGSPTQAGTTFEIPEGMHAMSVEVDVPTGVANIIEPTDRVSLIAHVERDREGDDDGDPATDEAGQALGVSASPLDQVVVQPGVTVEFRGGWSQYVLQDIEVLAIGQRVVDPASEQDGELQATQGTVMLTLAVTPEQAERLTMAIFEADLYATLLPDGATTVETGGVTLADLFK